MLDVEDDTGIFIHWLLDWSAKLRVVWKIILPFNILDFFGRIPPAGQLKKDDIFPKKLDPTQS